MTEEIVRELVDGVWVTRVANQGGGGVPVTAADIDSQAASNGEVLTADGAGGASWEADGGSQPVTSAYSGNPVAVAHGSGAVTLTFDTHEQGEELLDLTDPENPLFLQAGVYVMTLQTYADDGVPYEVEFVLGSYGGALGCQVPATSGGGNAVGGLTRCAPQSVGDQLNATVRNFDGAVDTNIKMEWLEIVFFPAA